MVQIDFRCLTVSLGNTLNLILLLDGVAVGGATGSVDDLISQALGNGLNVAERSLTSTSGHQVDGLVDATERGDIDGLSADDTSGTDASAVFARTTVDDGINDDLNGVLVSQDVDQLEGVANDANSHDLLAVVATVAHHGASQALNDGALKTKVVEIKYGRPITKNSGILNYLSLSESLSLVSASSVGHEGSILAVDSDIVLKGRSKATRSDWNCKPNQLLINHLRTWREISLTWTSSRAHFPKSLTGLADSAIFTQFDIY